MRQYYLDSAGGLLLLHMILWHCSQFAGVAIDYQMATAVLACFMPWFFYKGGMFYRQKPIAKIAVDGARRLLVPFAIFTAIGVVLDVVRFAIIGGESVMALCYAEAHSLVMGGAVPGNLALWFLPSLFVVRVVYAWCDSLFYLLKYSVLLIVCVAPFVIYVVWGSIPSGIPVWVVNIPVGLFFYAAGAAVGPLRLPVAAIVLLAIAYAVVMTMWPTIGDARDGVMEVGSRWAWYPMALLGIWAVNALCRWLLDTANPLSYIGRNTMPFYCWHWPVIVVTQMLLPQSFTGWTRFAALASACLVMLPLLKYAVTATKTLLLSPNITKK